MTGIPEINAESLRFNTAYGRIPYGTKSIPMKHMLLPVAGFIAMTAFTTGCRTAKTTTTNPPPKVVIVPGEKTDPGVRIVTTPASVPTKTLPPGQAKKVTGDKSAKSHAPGQLKKTSGEQSAVAHAPGQQKKVTIIRKKYPLIIVKTPALIVHKHTNGKYYHRNNDGLYYWKGDDGKFYLDQYDLDKVEYDEKSYKEWSAKGKKK